MIGKDIGIGKINRKSEKFLSDKAVLRKHVLSARNCFLILKILIKTVIRVAIITRVDNLVFGIICLQLAWRQPGWGGVKSDLLLSGDI